MIRTRLASSAIARYAKDAGWKGQDLITAVAVCLAESGGWVEAVSPIAGTYPTSGTRDFGLWQVNLYGDHHGEMFDPQSNADRAYSVFVTRGWRGWVSFTSGAYLRYVEEAHAAVTALDFPDVHLANLRYGIHHPDVRRYQEHLRSFIPGAEQLNPAGATGFFGLETQAMTKYAYNAVLHMHGGDLSAPGPALARYIKLNPL